VFGSHKNWQDADLMERPEEHALHEVDRIAVAVESLRGLLIAATAAELRANGRRGPAEESAGYSRPPLP
jgi:hypothetical protein